MSDQDNAGEATLAPADEGTPVHAENNIDVGIPSEGEGGIAVMEITEVKTEDEAGLTQDQINEQDQQAAIHAEMIAKAKKIIYTQHRPVTIELNYGHRLIIRSAIATILEQFTGISRNDLVRMQEVLLILEGIDPDMEQNNHFLKLPDDFEPLTKTPDEATLKS